MKKFKKGIANEEDEWQNKSVKINKRSTQEKW